MPGERAGLGGHLLKNGPGRLGQGGTADLTPDRLHVDIHRWFSPRGRGSYATAIARPRAICVCEPGW